MSENRLVEPFLRRRRYSRTVEAMRSFDAAYTPGTSADGQEFFEMRSAMDIRPTAGKEISRKAVRSSRGGVPTDDLARTSSFVAFDEIDACVQGLRRDGVYVFEQRIPEDMVARMRESALNVPSTPRGLEATPGPYPREAPQVGAVRHRRGRHHVLA